MASTFARAFSIPEIIQGMLAAKKPEDVLAVAPLAEVVLPENLELLPNSGSFPGLSGPAREPHGQ